MESVSGHNGPEIGGSNRVRGGPAPLTRASFPPPQPNLLALDKPVVNSVDHLSLEAFFIEDGILAV